MTKEEILEKSRSDNGGKDIEDLEVQKSAATVACGYLLIFMVLLVLFILQLSGKTGSVPGAA